MRGERALLQTAVHDRRQLRTQTDGGGLHVVDEQFGQLPGGNTGLKRPSNVGDVVAVTTDAALPQAVDFLIAFGGGDLSVRGGDHPVVFASGVELRHGLASAAADGRAAVQAEGNVGTQPRGQLIELCVADVDVPQALTGDEHSGGVGRSARQAPGDRDAFLEMNIDVGGDVGVYGHQLGRTHRQVRFIGGQLSRALPGDGDRHSGVGGIAPHRDRVVQRDGLVDGGELVESVGPYRTDTQVRIDLGTHIDRHDIRALRRRGFRFTHKGPFQSEVLTPVPST